MNKFEDFIWEKNPALVKAFARKEKYQSNLITLVGKNVRTLRAGFGGMGGQLLKVTAVDSKSITLERISDGAQYSSLVNENRDGVWYLDFEVVEDERFTLSENCELQEVYPGQAGGKTRPEMKAFVDQLREEKRELLKSGTLRPSEYVGIESHIISLSRTFRDLMA